MREGDHKRHVSAPKGREGDHIKGESAQWKRENDPKQRLTSPFKNSYEYEEIYLTILDLSMKVH